jgi:hypothetical protein
MLLVLTSIGLVLLLLRGGTQRWLWIPSLAGFLAVLGLVIAPLAPLLDRERQLPLRQLARQAALQARPGEPLWVVGTKRYSTLFYSGQKAVFVSGRTSIEDRLKDAPTQLGLVTASPTVRLLGDRSALDGLELPADRIQRLASQGQQEVWRVAVQDFQTP